MMDFMPELMSERLLLRAFTEKDIPHIYNMFADAELNTFLPWYPLKSLKEAEIFYRKHYQNNQGYHYAICLHNDNIPIGYINISEDESHDLGYGLKQEFRHKGIMREACHMVINQLRNDNVPYITATHDVRNAASGHVMQALGMTYRYSYKELWQPKGTYITFRMYQLNLDGHEERIYKKYWDMWPEHEVEMI